MANMTLEDIERIEREYLTPAEVASVLHCSRGIFMQTIKSDSYAYGFPTVRFGNRVKFPAVRLCSL